MSPEEKAEKLRRFLQQIAPEENLEGLAQEPETALEGLADEETIKETKRANTAVEKLSKREALGDDDMDALEAIILPRERPVVNIVGDTFNAPPPPWTDLGRGAKKATLDGAIPSIGRVEVPDHPKVPYGGTGFVVGDGLLMTNRHVAVFVSGLGRLGLEFKPGQTAGLDFRREVVPSDPVYVEVKEVLMVHPYWDMALLSVAGLPAGHGSLTLDVAHPDDLEGREIAIVGYPAQDWRNDLDLQNRIFGGIYNVKRLQPGKLTGRGSVRSYGKPVDALTHDSSTLGGNSGSAVVDVATGRIVGLHFAGRILEANFAVPTYELARDARVVDAVSFSGTVQPTAAWASFWDAADPADEGASPAPSSSVAATAAAPAAVAATAAAGPVTRGAVTVDGAAATWTIPLQVSVTLGHPTAAAGAPGAREAAVEAPGAAIDPDPDYDRRPGYDRAFLGGGVDVRIPWLTDEQYANVAFNREATSHRHVLPYHHFSLVMNRQRRLAYFTAVNIDGRREKHISRQDFSDRWFLDPRILRSEQLENDLYVANPLDRGHLVRRLDPVWGQRFSDAKAAHDDTFHWTNCSPQHERFNRNRTTWGLVENYILEQANAFDQRLTVFTGPVFRDDDAIFKTRDGDRVPLPREFWKVVALRKPDGELSATGYLLSQDDLIDNLTEAIAEPTSFQTTVREIERLTGLSFHQLRDHDPLAAASEEALAPAQVELRSFADLRL